MTRKIRALLVCANDTYRHAAHTQFLNGIFGTVGWQREYMAHINQDSFLSVNILREM